MLSERIKSISASSTLGMTEKVKELSRQGIKVIDLSVGEPDFDTPDLIKNYAIKAIRVGFTKYTPSSGIPELKQAIQEKLARDNGLTYSTRQIVVSCGAKHAIFNIIYALCGPGDEVIIPVPYWVSYPEQVKACGAQGVFVRTAEAQGFRLEPKELARHISRRTKLIILNSPNNPTGMVYDQEALQAIAELAVKKRIYLLADEIYEKLIYPAAVQGGVGKNALRPIRHISIASLGPRIKDLTIVVNGVSKSYAMTGWRIGYAAGPAPIMEAVGRFQSHVTSNPNSMAQKAALAALRYGAPAMEKMVRQFDTRRRYVVARLKRLPELTFAEPQGAFYVLINVSRVFNKKIKDSVALADRLLTQAHIAVVPGVAFGAPNHIRISYANSLPNLAQGLDRLEAFLRGLG